MSEELLQRIQGASEGEPVDAEVNATRPLCETDVLSHTASGWSRPFDDDVVATTFGPLPETMRAADIASKAAELVGGDRDRQHGAKEDNFARIATVWNAWLAIRKVEGPLDAHDVGCMMAMMKLARTQSGAVNVDDYVDAAGYAACAGEVAQG